MTGYFTSSDISFWDTSNVTSRKAMQDAFLLQKIYLLLVGHWMNTI